MAKPVVLTVDDDAEVLSAIARDLRKHYGRDYRVLRADSGAAALAVLRELRDRKDPVALVVSDQRMPSMDGVTLLSETMALHPKSKRALLTAYADTEAAIAAINRSQVDYYLLKPWDPPEERLYPVLDELLDDWRASFRPGYGGVRVVGDRRSASRVSDLVGAVKRFTYMDRQQAPEAIDLLQGVRDSVALLAHKARDKSVGIDVDVENGLPRVWAIGSDLNQVWTNLLDNGLDAVPESGQVTVTATRELDRVVVRVIDNGLGIPAGISERIFDPFFTTKPVGQGTGLGLEMDRVGQVGVGARYILNLKRVFQPWLAAGVTFDFKRHRVDEVDPGATSVGEIASSYAPGGELGARIDVAVRPRLLINLGGWAHIGQPNFAAIAVGLALRFPRQD